MQYLVESPVQDAHFNLALEHYLFERNEASWCMLWRNRNAIIVGRHQNTLAEINREVVKKQGIQVVRRRSGGGAVYHDLGNINFSFVTERAENENPGFELFCRPVLELLASQGVRASLSGRNDLSLAGKKISGNAQFVSEKRILHHGTLLYDADLDRIEQALQPSQAKISHKGLSSVRERVTNIRGRLPVDMPVEGFFNLLKGFLHRELNLADYRLTRDDIEKVREIEKSIYGAWDWNFGRSPAYALQARKKFECGTVELYLDVAEGRIRGCEFRGDFISLEDPSGLASALLGASHSETGLRQALVNNRPDKYFPGMSENDLVGLFI